MLNLQLGLDSLSVDQQGRELLQKGIDYLQEATQDLRALSHRLAPEVDEETRLFEKIHELIRRMNVRSSVKVHLVLDDFFSANQKIQLVVYRIIQEQFTNII
ncbi:MAG: hypothetical protein JWP27_2947 [Flaviaesturariibacter sp.]|nr:hypothetical protein [Flaviaesturariibacter sp.]